MISTGSGDGIKAVCRSRIRHQFEFVRLSVQSKHEGKSAVQRSTRDIREVFGLIFGFCAFFLGFCVRFRISCGP